MKLITYELTGKSVTEMTTEIKFFIANCKVKNIDLFKLSINKAYTGTREERRFSSIERILTEAKRSSLIQLFIDAKELSGTTTEAAYINNKYPSLCSEELEGNCYIIKL